MKNHEEQTCIRAREARERRSKEHHTKRTTQEEIIVTDGKEITLVARHIIWFWERIQKTDGCWLWTGSKWDNGYGRMMVGGKRRKAHRIAFLIHNGHLPADLKICHTCDNPPCCNPAHLFAGTTQDNSSDMKAKGRSVYGTRNGRAILTEDDVKFIRSSNRISGPELAATFGVTKTSISNVKRKITWTRI